MGRKKKPRFGSMILTLKFKNFNQESPPKNVGFFQTVCPKVGVFAKMDDLSQFPVRRLQSANIAWRARRWIHPCWVLLLCRVATMKAEGWRFCRVGWFRGSKSALCWDNKCRIQTHDTMYDNLTIYYFQYSISQFIPNCSMYICF